MSMEYKKFSTFIEKVQYGYTAEETSSVEGDAKYLRITDIVPYFVDKERVPYCTISEKKKEQYLVKENDLLIARTGATTGYNLVIPKGFDNFIFASYLVRYFYNQNELFPQYLKHVLKSNQYYGFVNNYIGGSAQPGMNPAAFGKFEVPYVEYEKQKRIAKNLSTYDNLIETNNKRIKVLERMAENLYKEWFVRFRFPGYETAEFENGLPKGWIRKRADEVISFNPTLPIGNQSSFTIIPMEALSTTSMVMDSKSFIIQDFISGRRSQNGDTLFAKITPCLENGKTGFVMGLPDGEVVGGSTEFIVLRSKALTPHYVYCLARSYYFRQTAILSMNGADGRQRVDEDKLKATKVVQPARKVLEQFEKIVSPIFEQVHCLTAENDNLIKQRDLLLPRLMSGKWEVE